MRKRILAALPMVFMTAWCFGQSNFVVGENMFMYNEPESAAAYLENAIVDDPAHVEAFLYLGIVYEQLDRTDDAIGVYQRILDQAGDLTANVANNLGNVYFKAGSDAEAEASYTQALEADAAYASAYLGRANTRLKTGSMRDAAADYEQYLNLEPDAPQQEAIQQLLAYIQAEFDAAESQRLSQNEVISDSAAGNEDDHE